MSDLYVLKEGEKWGPYSTEELSGHVEAGSFVPTDLVWAEGFADWMPLASLIAVEIEEPDPIYFEDGDIQVTRDFIKLEDKEISLGLIAKASVQVEKVRRFKPLVGSIVVGVIVLCVAFLEIPRNTTTAWIIWSVIVLALAAWWLRLLVTGLRAPSSLIVIDLADGNEGILQVKPEVALKFGPAAQQALADFRARVGR